MGYNRIATDAICQEDIEYMTIRLIIRSAIDDYVKLCKKRLRKPLDGSDEMELHNLRIIIFGEIHENSFFKRIERCGLDHFLNYECIKYQAKKELKAKLTLSEINLHNQKTEEEYASYLGTNCQEQDIETPQESGMASLPC